MLRRCIWELSPGRSFANRRWQNTAQMPSFLSSRNFSNVSQQKSSQGPAPPETSRSGNFVSKLVLGSVVVGAAAMAAYKTGYIDLHLKNEKYSLNSNKLDADKALEHLEHSADQVILPSNEQQNKLKPDMETVEKRNSPHDLEDLEINKEVVPETTPSYEEPVAGPVKESELSSFPQEIMSTADEETINSKSSSDDTLKTDNSMAYTPPNVEQSDTTEISMEQNDGIDFSTNVSEESGIKEAAPHHAASVEMPMDSQDNDTKALKSLADSYSLQADEGNPKISGKGETADASATFLKDKEASVTNGNSKDKNEKDGKIVLDLIEAIDAAKRKQAESDAYIFAEEKRILKEKYEKELKDARARELMYAEEAAILEKELNKEKAKAAATIKLVQEKADQNLQEELQHKEEEAAIELKKAQELAKAELAAAIASEKSSQIEKIAEANLNINALCIAFYARSEEARQTHSVHKLALGTLALEDALSKGLPIRAEVDALHKSLEGIDRDSLLELALSSLPEETLHYGTSTQMQLNQKFDSLKGSLRHFSLIPAGGGGILAHTVAHIASSIKMKEDQSGDGIESLISKVECFLVEGKIAEATDALEGGVRGSEAEEVVVEWVRQARNRAVAEQVLSLLQSYAMSITFA